MRTKGVSSAFALALASLLGCRKAPQPEPQRIPIRTTVRVAESTPGKSAPAEDNCGLTAFPVSKSTQDILAAAPRDGTSAPNSAMHAKIAIDPEGRVTHLRVLRLAYPEAANSVAINQQAIDSIKRWHYAPTIFNGEPVAVCSEVFVTIDF
jgi:outer membrane biosynthesis protein TonB